MTFFKENFASIVLFLFGIFAYTMFAIYQKMEYLIYCGTGFITIAGWIFNANQKMKTDQIARSQQYVNEYLITIYLGLERIANQSLENKENSKKLEEAFAKIQLLGQESEIELVLSVIHEALNSKNSKGGHDFHILELLTLLRKRLRNNLRIDPIEPKYPIEHLRID